MVMEHLPPAPSPSHWPCRGFSSSAIGVGVLGPTAASVGLLEQPVNKAATAKPNAPHKNRLLTSHLINLLGTTSRSSHNNSSPMGTTWKSSLPNVLALAPG